MSNGFHRMALHLQKNEDRFNKAFIPVNWCVNQYMNNEEDAIRQMALNIDNQIMYFQYLASNRSS